MKSIAIVLLLATALPGADHRVLQVMPLSGQGGQALLVDSASRRLYVARSNHLLVLDIDSGRQIADVRDLPGIAAIAVAPEIDRGYVTSTQDNRVSIFALKDFAHLGGIPLGSNPRALVYDTSAHRFYAMNTGSRNASAIDADDGEVERTIDLGGRPAGAATDDHGTVYVVVEDRSEIARIDAKKMALRDRWAIPGCKAPHGIAIDDRKGRLFIGCAERRLMVLSTADGKLLGAATTGEGGGEIAADSAGGFAYVANREGSISVVTEVSAGKYETVETVATERGATALAFDPVTHHLFTLVPTRPPAPADGRKPGESEAAGPSQLLVIGR